MCVHACTPPHTLTLSHTHMHPPKSLDTYRVEMKSFFISWLKFPFSLSQLLCEKWVHHTRLLPNLKPVESLCKALPCSLFPHLFSLFCHRFPLAMVWMWNGPYSLSTSGFQCSDGLRGLNTYLVSRWWCHLEGCRGSGRWSLGEGRESLGVLWFSDFPQQVSSVHSLLWRRCCDSPPQVPAVMLESVLS